MNNVLARPKDAAAIAIYVNYFGDAQVVKSKYLVPLQVGRARSPRPLAMLGDDTGDNISDKNPVYCEITGQYWAWKNDKTSRYIGLMHYRRFFDFMGGHDDDVDSHGLIVETAIDARTRARFGLTDAQIEHLVLLNDVVLPQPFDVTGVGCTSVYQQYQTAGFHYISDFDIAGDVIRQLTPEYSRTFTEVANGRTFYTNNMFILRRDIYDAYTEWLMTILTELESRLDISRYNVQEARVIGYIAERLFTVFITKYRSDHPDLRVTELNRVLFTDTSRRDVGPELPATSLPVVSVAASCDRAYVAQLGALIASVYRNADRGHFIEFIVLDGGIGAENRRNLADLTKLHPHCCLSFVDMADRFNNIETHSYFPTSTFYRLALPQILEGRDKVLFLDTDMIVNADISTLFETDLGSNVVAAVPDLIMRAFCARGAMPLAEAGSSRATTYLTDKLRLGNRTNEYFQAGTILFDLAKMRQARLSERMEDDLTRHRYWFLDQDVLNKHLFGKVQFLDNRWNVVYMDDDHRSSLAAGDRVTYQATQDDPFIIHYAGAVKPWVDWRHPKTSYFWKYLRDTHWYEAMLFDVWRGMSASPAAAAMPGLMSVPPVVAVHWPLSARLARGVWRILPMPVRKPMLPVAHAIKCGLLG